MHYTLSMNKYVKNIDHSTDFFSENPRNVFFTHSISFGDEESYHDHCFYEIIYIQSDQIKHIVNNQWLNLKLGDIVFLRPNDCHIYVRDNNKCAHRDLIFETKFFEQTCNWFNCNLLKLYKSPILPYKISLSSDAIIRIENQITNINKTSLDELDKRETLTKALLVDLLSTLYNHINLDVYSNPYPILINHLLETANINFAQPIHTIFSQFNYDKSYICRQFKKHVGVTMTEYINNLRLNYVLSQLNLTQKNILDISLEAGFHSVSYLNHLFKKQYGVTPSEYRKTRSFLKDKL